MVQSHTVLDRYGYMYRYGNVSTVNLTTTAAPGNHTQMGELFTPPGRPKSHLNRSQGGLSRRFQSALLLFCGAHCDTEDEPETDEDEDETHDDVDDLDD